MGKDKNSKADVNETINLNTNNQEEVAMSNSEITNNIPNAEVNVNPNNEGGITMEQSYDEKVMALAAELGMDPDQLVNDMEVIDASNKRGGGRSGDGSGKWAATRNFTIRYLKIAAATGRKRVFFGDVVRACILPQTGIWAAWKYQGKLVTSAEVKAQQIPLSQLKVVSDITDKQMRYRQCMNYIRNNFLSLEGDKGFKVGKAKSGLPEGWDVHYIEGGKGDSAIAFVYKG